MTDGKKFSPFDPRPPTTYFELAQRPDDDGRPAPDNKVPRQPEHSFWHHDPIPIEPPSEVGADCGTRLGIALGGKGGGDDAQ